MNENQTIIHIALSVMRGNVPEADTLRGKLASAMKYVRENQSDLFWMSYNVNDDLMIRTSLAFVMLHGTEEEKDILARSMEPLHALSAAMSGVPVDFESIKITDDLIPIIGVWNETKA